MYHVVKIFWGTVKSDYFTTFFLNVKSFSPFLTLCWLPDFWHPWKINTIADFVNIIPTRLTNLKSYLCILPSFLSLWMKVLSNSTILFFTKFHYHSSSQGFYSCNFSLFPTSCMVLYVMVHFISLYPISSPLFSRTLYPELISCSLYQTLQKSYL